MKLKNSIKLLSLTVLLACSANTAFSSSSSTIVVIDKEQLVKHRQVMIECVSKGDLKGAIVESKAYDKLLGNADEHISIMNKFYTEILDAAQSHGSLDALIKDFNKTFVEVRSDVSDAESLIDANRMLIKILREKGMDDKAHSLFHNAIVECTKQKALMDELFNAFADNGF